MVMSQKSSGENMKHGLESNVVLGSALIDLYAKCGRLSEARKVFDNLITKNLVSWNTMLLGYAQHGFGREAFEIYSIMQRNGIEPNDITFLGVLSACGGGMAPLQFYDPRPWYCPKDRSFSFFGQPFCP